MFLLTKLNNGDRIKSFSNVDLSTANQWHSMLKEAIIEMAKKIEILDAMEKYEFPTIFRAINDCIGTEYSGWMTACWPNVKGNGNFRMWFPKLAKKRDGELVPAAFDCVNTISDDWNAFIF